MNNSSTIQVIADADSLIQMAGYYKVIEISTGGNVSNSIRMESTITTTYLTANAPQLLTLNFNVQANATYAIYEVGATVRLVTAGSNAVVFTGTSLTTTPTGWKYGNVGWITP
jgi:hypothetical protein